MSRLTHEASGRRTVRRELTRREERRIATFMTLAAVGAGVLVVGAVKTTVWVVRRARS